MPVNVLIIREPRPRFRITRSGNSMNLFEVACRRHRLTSIFQRDERSGDRICHR
jgi:hypothetical protein